MKRGILCAALTVGVVLFVATPEVQAHGGRTDSNGCHRDRSNGGRHCHGASSSSDSALSAIGSQKGKKKKRKSRKKRR